MNTDREPNEFTVYLAPYRASHILALAWDFDMSFATMKRYNCFRSGLMKASKEMNGKSKSSDSSSTENKTPEVTAGKVAQNPTSSDKTGQ